MYQADGITVAGITIYHYDHMGYLITETTESGQLIKDYIRQEGLHPVAQIDNNSGTESINYLYTDHLQTSRLATSQNQSIVWRWEGEAFGNTAAQELAGVEVNLRFPGQYYDQETGLHYNHWRYYDPYSGRYITSDPIGLAGGLNIYGYALQNPVKYIDPDGRLVWLVIPGICAGGGCEALGIGLAWAATTIDWPVWGPFDNPDVDTESGSETIDDCIEGCLDLLDIGDGGSAYHKCVADCKRKNDLFPSCE